MISNSLLTPNIIKFGHIALECFCKLNLLVENVQRLYLHNETENEPQRKYDHSSSKLFTCICKALNKCR